MAVRSCIPARRLRGSQVATWQPYALATSPGFLPAARSDEELPQPAASAAKAAMTMSEAPARCTVSPPYRQELLDLSIGVPSLRFRFALIWMRDPQSSRCRAPTGKRGESAANRRESPPIEAISGRWISALV
jgi:hypothetical protein